MRKDGHVVMLPENFFFGKAMSGPQIEVNGKDGELPNLLGHLA